MKLFSIKHCRIGLAGEHDYLITTDGTLEQVKALFLEIDKDPPQSTNTGDQECQSNTSQTAGGS